MSAVGVERDPRRARSEPRLAVGVARSQGGSYPSTSNGGDSVVRGCRVQPRSGSRWPASMGDRLARSTEVADEEASGCRGRRDPASARHLSRKAEGGVTQVTPRGPACLAFRVARRRGMPTAGGVGNFYSRQAVCNRRRPGLGRGRARGGWPRPGGRGSGLYAGVPRKSSRSG